MRIGEIERVGVGVVLGSLQTFGLGGMKYWTAVRCSNRLRPCIFQVALIGTSCSFKSGSTMTDLPKVLYLQRTRTR
jgi:hypothetical protein